MALRAQQVERDRALRRLVDEGVISAEQETAVREALTATAPARARLTEVAGYLGGGLLLAGAATLVAASWQDLARAIQVTLLIVATVGLLAAGVAVAGGPRARTRTAARARLAAVLLTLASGTAALAAGVAADAYEVVVAGAAGLVVAVGGYVLVPSALALLAAVFFSALAAGSLADELFAGRLDTTSLWPTGMALMLVGTVWVVLALTGASAQRAAGLGAGAVVVFIGAQQLLGHEDTEPWGYGLTFAIALAFLALYWRERTWVPLVAGVAGVSVAVPEALWDWTDGAVGTAMILLVAGAVLVTASVIGVKLHHRTEGSS